jgi:hypothetical protein
MHNWIKLSDCNLIGYCTTITFLQQNPSSDNSMTCQVAETVKPKQSLLFVWDIEPDLQIFPETCKLRLEDKTDLKQSFVSVNVSKF